MENLNGHQLQSMVGLLNNKSEVREQEILADSTIDIGTFKNDLRHGNGTLYDKNKKIIQTGKLVNGRFQQGTNFTISETESGKTSYKTKSNSFLSNPRIVNLGLGISSFYSLGSYSLSDGSSISIPIKSISDDIRYEPVESLTLSGYFGYTGDILTINNSYLRKYIWRNSNCIFSARAADSYDLSDSIKTILCGSVMIGYNLASSSYLGDDAFNYGFSGSVGGFTYSRYPGIRHMFKQKKCGFFEFGYCIAYLTAGVSLRI